MHTTTYDSNPETHSHTAQWVDDDHAQRICHECERHCSTYLEIKSRQKPVYIARAVCCRCAYFTMTDDGLKYPFPCVTAELVSAPHLWRGALDQMTKVAQDHIDALNNLETS